MKILFPKGSVKFFSDISHSKMYLLSQNSIWIFFEIIKGAIIFYREGGPSVCDRGLPIFSGPPLGMRKKILVPPSVPVSLLFPPQILWRYLRGKTP